MTLEELSGKFDNIMTLEELSGKFDNIIRDMESNMMGDMMVQIGSTALTMIKKRVIETGVNADGQKFPPYSIKPSLTNCSALTTNACSAIAGSKEKRKNLDWVTLQRGGRNIKLFKMEGGYKQYREMLGRQTGHVDFSLTNRMWNNIQLQGSTSEYNQGVARITTSLDEEQKKLQGNEMRKGEILMLSGDEISLLNGIAVRRLRDIFKKNGL